MGAVLGFNGLGLAAPMLLGHATAAANGVTINEISSASSPEWVELYAVTTTDISGWTVHFDASSATQITTVPANTLLAAGNYYQVNAASSWLSNTGDTVVLRNSANTTVESVSYGAEYVGGQGSAAAPSATQSLARSADNGCSWIVSDTPTPGASNGTSAIYDENQACSYPTLEAAVSNANAGDTLYLNTDVSIAHEITITQTLTIDGNGHTVRPIFTKSGNDNNASFGIIGTAGVTLTNLTVDGAGTNLHGINVYHSTGVWLDGLTLKNNSSFGSYGLVVNGSIVTVNNITTAGNFGGIDADKGTSTSPVVLTILGTSHHNDSPLSGIFVDNTSDVTINDVTQQYAHYPFLTGELYTLMPTSEACNGSTFDNFALGSVNGQNGWTSTGPYDQAVVRNTYGYAAFGCQSLRLSNAVTSGSFGDQTFSAPAAQPAGETVANNHYEASFDIASTQNTEQTGLSISVSPDRGDGSRMSYLRFQDSPTGIAVYFDDVTTTTNPASWNEDQVATLDRTVPHTVKFVIDFVDGPSNDVVKIYIDGTLVKTGTTWENYYRFDSESNSEPVRTVDSLLFRAAGTSAPLTNGNGLLFDNVAVTTSAVQASDQGGKGGDTTTPPTPTTPMGVVLSSTGSQNISNATTSETNGSVLSDTTSTPATTNEQTQKQDKTKNDKSSADTSGKTSCAKWGGICWYWWIPIVLGVAAIIYWYLRAADTNTTTSGR
jgi:hypothetical protein